MLGKVRNKEVAGVGRRGQEGQGSSWSWNLGKVFEKDRDCTGLGAWLGRPLRNSNSRVSYVSKTFIFLISKVFSVGLVSVRRELEFSGLCGQISLDSA